MFHAFPCSFSFLSGMLCFLSFFSSYYWPFWEFGACETIYLWLEIDVAQFCFWNRWDAILLISELGLVVLLDISLSLQNCCVISVIIWSVNIYILLSKYAGPSLEGQPNSQLWTILSYPPSKRRYALLVVLSYYSLFWTLYWGVGVFSRVTGPGFVFFLRTFGVSELALSNVILPNIRVATFDKLEFNTSLIWAWVWLRFGCLIIWLFLG